MSERSELVKLARERYEAAESAMTDTHARMREDLRFSNPANPEQWESAVLNARRGDATNPARPCFTFDQTNQYIAQVVNDARMNKPSIKVVPVGSGADVAVAETLEGVVRHIEYASRASIAYDTGVELQARVGLGWLRVLPEVVDPELGLQEIRIRRIHDALSVLLDPDSTEPDGSDAQWGFVETRISRKKFERLYPGKKIGDAADSWAGEKDVRVCEYFYLEDGKCVWVKLSGEEELESTEFPSRYIPLIPILGYELWIEGKRYICGMVRRMMDGARAYNYERTAYIEAVALQPKAPFIVPFESIDGHEDKWRQANAGVPFLPYNAVDPDTRTALPMPQRSQPPSISTGFVQGGALALNDIQASVGMYRANLGAPSNETSGKAINARKLEGDTANYHYVDNLARSMTQLGKIIVDMIPRIYDTKRIAQIMGDDGKVSSVSVDPGMREPVRRDGGKVSAINPTVGTYDVRVTVGPGYTTLRQESAESLSRVLERSPDLLPILGGEWAQMQDWPNAEKVARKLAAMAPPQIQALEQGDAQLPPEAQAQVTGLQQQLEQVAGQAQAQMQQLQQQLAQAMEAATKATREAAQAKLDAAQKDLSAEQQITQLRGQLARSQLQTEAVKLEDNLEDIVQQGVQQIQTLMQQAQALVPPPAAPEMPVAGSVDEPGDVVMVAPAGPSPELQQVLAAISEVGLRVIAALQAPKQVLRDEQGLVVGVAPVGA